MASARVNPKSQASSRPQKLQISSELLAHARMLGPDQAQMVIDLLKAAQASQVAPATAELSEPVASIERASFEQLAAKARASKLAFKTVNEIWDEKAYKYKIEQSTDSSRDFDELDEYIFVIRVRTNKKTAGQTFFVDIKSAELRDILRTVLQDIKGFSLREDKPTVEQKLLYNRLPELEGYQREASSQKHLNLLVDSLRIAYASTTKSLNALLEHHEIEYDLLWALFKPNAIVYSTCFGTGKPRCVKFDFGEERISSNGLEYFHLECRYMDFDGKVFGEAAIELSIPKFRGTKRVNSLNAYPFKYHPSRDGTKASLVGCGRKFVSLTGVHHCQYRGVAFYMHKGQPVKLPVNSRVTIDAVYFQEANPNHTRPRISELDIDGDMFSHGDNWMKRSSQVKCNGINPAEMEEDDLILCSPTVQGFSYGNKLWLEFAVADIKGIEWDPTAFAQLTIPSKQKEVIQALAEAHINRGSDYVLDDIVAGKGMGLIVLLHGLPGIGKTLTAEGISEHLQRPLYAISAGELGTTVEKLESQLPLIFQRANKWNAILLFDEADVFLEQRSTQDVHRNALVSVFLRELEYYQGIMFLTTNRVKQIDDAIASRIHLPLKYQPLGFNARRTIWECFLRKAVTSKGPPDCSRKELDSLVERNFNGRQIKNIVCTAHALATRKGKQITIAHLEIAIDASEDFECDFRGAGHAAMVL